MLVAVTPAVVLVAAQSSNTEGPAAMHALNQLLRHYQEAAATDRTAEVIRSLPGIFGSSRLPLESSFSIAAAESTSSGNAYGWSS